LGPKRVAVICAEDEIALTAASDGLLLGICLPVLIGNDHNIRSLAAELHLTALLDKASIVPAEEPVKVAVQMARAGEVDILLKGHMRSDQLLTAVLDRDCGLRTGRVLADIALFPMACADGSQRLVSMGDGGVNVAPDLQQKKAIIESSIETMQCLGVARPKVAILSATEAVTDRMPSTLDARILTEMAAAGAFGDAEVFGHWRSIMLCSSGRPGPKVSHIPSQATRIVLLSRTSKLATCSARASSSCKNLPMLILCWGQRRLFLFPHASSGPRIK